MLRVGLTGGYATGKSYVAGELERLGAKVIYADVLGHEVLLPSGEAYAPAVQLFGQGILGTDDLIDRKKLAQLVFGYPDRLKRLSDLVHPGVRRLEARLAAEHAELNPHAIIVTEAAILIETGRYKDFDRLIVTVCSLETQIRRGIKRDRLTREEVLERIGRQMPSDQKQNYAHYVVNTDGPKSVTVTHVKRIFSELSELASNT
jgi:dephospho-CoA kinase